MTGLEQENFEREFLEQICKWSSYLNVCKKLRELKNLREMKNGN